jgi:Txe/YoeB family toxin of toxin-antitoxin system
MELFFNELSVHTSTEFVATAKDRVVNLLKTARALKAQGFNHIRTHDNFFAEDLGGGYTASHFLTDPTNDLTLRTLLQSIIKNPFIPANDTYEAEAFILNRFEIMDTDGAILQPEGLASAYIYESHSISFSGHPHWERLIIPIQITPAQQPPLSTEIINHAHESSVTEPIFIDWLKSFKQDIPLNTVENIYKVFPAHQFYFEEKAINDLIEWYYDDIRFQIRIKKLIENIAAYPFTGGLGHTEVLTSSGGRASKRIIGKDRLVYTFTQEKITIHQCKGHYDDH